MLQLSLVKTTEEELNLIKKDTLQKTKILFEISQIFEPENSMRELIVINKNHVQINEDKVSFWFELEDLTRPERCQIKIKEILFAIKDRKKLKGFIEKSYPFLQIKTESIERARTNSEIAALQIEKAYKDIAEIKSKVDVVPISGHFGFFKEKEDPIELFREIEAQLESVGDLESEDLEFNLREKLLECVFLSISNISSLKVIDDVEIREITAKLIQRYYGSDLN